MLHKQESAEYSYRSTRTKFDIIVLVQEKEIFKPWAKQLNCHRNFQSKTISNNRAATLRCKCLTEGLVTTINSRPFTSYLPSQAQVFLPWPSNNAFLVLLFSSAEARSLKVFCFFRFCSLIDLTISIAISWCSLVCE